jgi:hypothetical protein
MHSKFAEANAKVYYSRADGEGAAQLLNQDAFSKLSYSFGHVSCSTSFRSKIQKLACKIVKHRGRLQSTVPYSCIMAPKDLNGYGLSNLHVTYRAEKVKFLRSIISTLDSLSRLTTLKCINSINQRLHYKLDILRPDSGRVHSKSKHWTDFPAFYKEGHQLLTDCVWSIRSQVNPTPVSSIGISQFLSPFLPIKLRGDPLATLRSEKLMLMNEILPENFEPTDNSGLKCPLDEI